MKKTFASAKNFVANHPVATAAVIVTLTVASVALSVSNAVEAKKFLENAEILEEINNQD